MQVVCQPALLAACHAHAMTCMSCRSIEPAHALAAACSHHATQPCPSDCRVPCNPLQPAARPPHEQRPSCLGRCVPPSPAHTHRRSSACQPSANGSCCPDQRTRMQAHLSMTSCRQAACQACPRDQQCSRPHSSCPSLLGRQQDLQGPRRLARPPQSPLASGVRQAAAEAGTAGSSRRAPPAEPPSHVRSGRPGSAPAGHAPRAWA